MAPFQFKSLCCVAMLSFRAVPRLSLLFLKYQAMMAKMTNSGLKNDISQTSGYLNTILHT